MNKLVFLNIGWMRSYEGLDNDSIKGGGKHIENEGWGGEICNFRALDGKNYGYVEIKGNINLDRIEKNSQKGYRDNVTVVWTAKSPSGGTKIIGWYRNARLYSSIQELPQNAKRIFENQRLGFVAVAHTNDCTLLPIDSRIVSVPRGLNGMGQRNVWYAGNNANFIKTAEDYIFNGILPPPKKPVKGNPMQPDPLKRAKVERKAVEIVIEHYSNMGYEVLSVEKDNVGWDLIAKYEQIELKIEVKGLSGTYFIAELTPNEYSNLKKHQNSYRLCIVAESLTPKPILRIFSYSTESQSWLDDENNQLIFDEKISARVSI